MRQKKVRSPVEVSRDAIASIIYTCWLHNGRRLMDERGVVVNLGKIRGAELECAKLFEARERKREMKRNKETP